MSALRKRMFDKTSVVFLVCILFYLIQAFPAIFYDFCPPVTDILASAAVLGFVYLLHILFGFKKTVPIFLTIGLFFNIIGLYNFIPYNEYYTGNLYGAPQLNYHYDWIAHSVGFGFFALAFSSLAYPYLRRAFRSHYAIFVFILLAMMGFGAIHEISEFMGFTFLGFGEGFLEFGEGDHSPFEGPWENTCMDLVNNMLGGIFFIGGFVLLKRYGSLNGIIRAFFGLMRRCRL